MLTPSVNVVQSSFDDERLGDLGLSRSGVHAEIPAGTAITVAILVAGLAATPELSYALALVVLGRISLAGLGGLPAAAPPDRTDDPVLFREA